MYVDNLILNTDDESHSVRYHTDTQNFVDEKWIRKEKCRFFNVC